GAGRERLERARVARLVAGGVAQDAGGAGGAQRLDGPVRIRKLLAGAARIALRARHVAAGLGAREVGRAAREAAEDGQVLVERAAAGGALARVGVGDQVVVEVRAGVAHAPAF